MNLISTLVLTITVAITYASAQEAPDWVDGKGSSPRFSENEYITGYGIASFTKHDNLVNIKQIAEENAKKNLSEKIMVQVKSSTKTLRSQTGMVYQQKLESEVISVSEIELPGLKKELYTDKKSERVYCLVYVPTSYLVKNYEYKLFEKTKELEGLFFAAREFEKQNLKDNALKSYLDCYPVLSAVTDLQTIIISLGKIPEVGSNINQVDLSHSISKLITTINSLNDLAFFIAFAFKEQTQGEVLDGVIVSPLTYKNTGMSSMFSKQFRETIEHHIITHNNWKTYPIKKYDPTIENMGKIRYAVKGSYWDSEDKIYINIFVSEIITGIKKASIEYEFNKSFVDETFIPLQPENYLQAKQDQDTFNKNEITTSGLILDVYTNKGTDDLIFSEGEKMKIYLKANMPCYVRLIYHLNDSSRILFLNNEYLDVDKVNKLYELPFTFICRGPFGVETLQVNAREKPFPKLKTTNQNGLIFVEEELPELLDNLRENKENILQAEKRLTITTMPN